MFGKRIKPDPAPMWVRQYDTYIGRTIVVRSEDDVECAQRKAVASIVGIEFIH